MTCRDLHMTGTIMNRSENLRAVCTCLLVCTNKVGVFVVLSGPLRSQSQHCSSLFLFFINVSFELYFGMRVFSHFSHRSFFAVEL